MNRRTITFTRQTTNRFGDSADGATVTVERCVVAPRGSSEQLDRRDTVTTGLTVYAPGRPDVRATDEATVDGVRYQVSGQPGIWESPFSNWQPGTEIVLERVTG